jgi:hypothetical protein
MLATRAAFVENLGSVIRSALPKKRKSRSAIACVSGQGDPLAVRVPVNVSRSRRDHAAGLPGEGLAGQ